MRIESPEHIVLFGGAPLLVRAAEAFRARGIAVDVFTSARQAAEAIEGSQTLADQLARASQPYVVTESIDDCYAALRARMTRTTLGLGLGEAWSFSRRILDLFSGRLIDFMGIPHPRYRGGAHYTWMILRGDRQMGCNLQLINEQMVQGERDTGEIIASMTYELPSSCKVPADYFAGAVEREVAFLLKFLDDAQRDVDFQPKPADETRSLFLPRLHTGTHAFIDWTWGGLDIARFIDAFDRPYPGARTHLDGSEVVLRDARLLTDEAAFHPFQSGLVTRVQDDGVVVATTSGHLVVHAFADGRSIDTEISCGARFDTAPEALSTARNTRVRYAAAGVVKG